MMSKQGIDSTDVIQICEKHGIEVKALKSISGSFDKKIFFINNELLLRVSETSMALEQEKFSRVAALNYVPKIKEIGVFEGQVGATNYTLLTLLPGNDFIDSYLETTTAQQKQMGKDIARFMDNLHALSGTHYDIGLYLPAIPNFTGSWREGHRKYWEILRHGSEALQLKPESTRVFERAFQFLSTSTAALDFQTGPVLLHNDFHPRNILQSDGKFAGVIDWECSQYGEADFELCHLIHWCLYPPEPYIDFRPFLGSLFQSSPRCADVPDLAERLTIYQIEHEIQQIIWHGDNAESWRVPRIIDWMEGGVDNLLRELG